MYTYLSELIRKLYAIGYKLSRFLLHYTFFHTSKTPVKSRLLKIIVKKMKIIVNKLDLYINSVYIC